MTKSFYTTPLRSQKRDRVKCDDNRATESIVHCMSDRVALITVTAVRDSLASHNREVGELVHLVSNWDPFSNEGDLEAHLEGSVGRVIDFKLLSDRATRGNGWGGRGEKLQ